MTTPTKNETLEERFDKEIGQVVYAGTRTKMANHHIKAFIKSELEAVFEEIEKLGGYKLPKVSLYESGNIGVPTEQDNEVEYERKRKEREDRLGIIHKDEDFRKGFNQAIREVLSLRQKYLPTKKGGRNE